MSIVRQLLCFGECEYSTEIDIYQLNKNLRPLGYECVLWYDKSKVILKNLKPTGYRNYSFEKVNETVKKLITKKPVENEISRMMENDGYIKNGVLTEKFYIQNEDFLINEYGYIKCSLCKIICTEGSEHEYCRQLYQSLRDKTS